MTERAAQPSAALAQGAAVWLWPAAAAVLSAWPVWRSVAPETPDIGEGWFRLELVLGLALVLLYCAWAWPRRKHIHDFAYPFWVILLALGGAVLATKRGDTSGADLCVLMIAWTASTAIFASLALLQVEDAGLAAGCKAPHHGDLFPPVLWLGAGYGIAMLGVTFLWNLAPASVLIMGVISPGAILAWAALSDTARSVLSARRVSFSNAWFLTDMVKRRHWRLMSPAVLLSDRPKLVSLYPAEDVKPGDLVALAAALTMDDKGELGRAIQEFGVSHRIRLPILKETPGQPAMQGRHATLSNGAEVELRDLPALSGGGLDLASFEEAIGLARSLSREVLAVVERRPQLRVLGLIVFAIGSRTGAAATLQSLRAQGIGVSLTAPPRDARDAPALKSLQVIPGQSAPDDSAPSDSAPGDSDEAIAVIRPEQPNAPEASILALCFGTARPAAGEPAAQLIAVREDPRVLADLARFAADFRARTFIVTLLSNAPGWVLIAAAFGYLPVSPLLVTGVAVAGIAIAVATPQVLRLSPTLAKEVDDE